MGTNETLHQKLVTDTSGPGRSQDCDGSVIQFMYGKDGLDTLHTKYLSGKAKQFDFLALNKDALTYKFNVPNLPTSASTGMAITRTQRQGED